MHINAVPLDEMIYALRLILAKMPRRFEESGMIEAEQYANLAGEVMGECLDTLEKADGRSDGCYQWCAMQAQDAAQRIEDDAYNCTTDLDLGHRIFGRMVYHYIHDLTLDLELESVHNPNMYPSPEPMD